MAVAAASSARSETGLPFLEKHPAGFSMIDEATNVYSTAEALVAWAQAARRGDSFVYASRCTRLFPASSRVAEVARELHDREFVALVQRRVPGTRDQRNYIAQRTGRPWSAPQEPRPALRVVRGPDAEAAVINTLLPVLRRAARFTRPCPTDAQLAARIGASVEAVQLALRALEATGDIRIGRAAAPTLRQVTIVATGHRTGMVA